MNPDTPVQTPTVTEDNLVKEIQASESTVLSEEDILKYGKNLEEFNELKSLENQFSKTSTDLEETKSKLSLLEQEIKIARENEEKRALRVGELIQMANEAEKGSKLHEALDYYLEILELEPRHARSVYHIQEIKKKQKQNEIQKLEQEQEAKRLAAEAREHFELGKSFYRESNFEKALGEFLSAILSGGKNPEILEYRDKCEQRIHEIEENLNRAKKELDEKRRQVNEYASLANTHCRKKEYEQAIQLLDKALLLIPDNKEIQETLRQAEIRLKEHNALTDKQNKENLDRLSKIRTFQIKAMEYERNEDFEKAISQLEEALLLEPGSREVSEQLQKLNENFVQYKKTNEEKQERLIKSKLEKDSLLSDHWAKGVNFFIINEFEKAMSHFSNVIALDPHYEQVERYMQKIDEKIQMREKEKNELALKEKLEAERQQARTLAEKQKKEQELKDLFETGLRLFSENNYEEALVRFEKCYAYDSLNEIYKKELEITRNFLNEKKEKELLEKAKEEEKKGKERIKQIKIGMHNEQAEAFFSAGYFEKAREEWNKIFVLDEINEKAKVGLLRVQNQLKIEEEKKVKAELDKQEKLLMIEKMNFDAKLKLSEENPDEAINIWEAVLKADPSNSDAKNGILECKKNVQEKKLCDEMKYNIEQFLDNQEKRLKEVRKIITEGLKFYQEKDYTKAYACWNSLNHMIIKQDS